MKRYDVIVVGARAAGAATALLLARAGLSVLVVDRGRYGSDTLSTHALMRGGVVQLHRWGLLEPIAARTPPIRRTVFHYAHDDLTVTIKPSHGADALYAPRRTVLDPVLVDAALAAGADVRHEVTVDALRRDRAGRVVGIDGHDRAGRTFVADAALVVGADGRRSIVAALAASPTVHEGTHAGAVTYVYWKGLQSDGYEWAFARGVAAGFIPTGDGLTCVFAGGPLSCIRRGDEATLRAVVHRASPAMGARLDAGTPASGTRAFPGRVGYLRQAWGNGWALVGDAGSWRDPISAHGLTDALRDAELLARSIIASARDGVELSIALARFTVERDRLSLPMLHAADRIAAYRWQDDEIPVLHRQLSAAMVDDVDAVVSFDPHPVTTGDPT